MAQLSASYSGVGIPVRKAVYLDMTLPLFPNYLTVCYSVIRVYRS